MDHAPPWPEDGSLIRVAIELPLARFVLRVDVELHTPATVIMGPSGGGKTSLLETIAGLRPRARGRIVLGDEVILDSNTGTTLRPEARRVGYVPQDAGLFPHLTALENVRFGARGDGSRVEAALDVLELRHLLQRYPVALSGGEKQRVALARALAINPRVLLLDEPLAALDVALRERVLPYLLRIRDEWQVPLVYVTHNVGEALALGGELVVIRNGTLEAQGPPLALLDSPDVSRATAGGLENLFQGQVVAHDSAGGITVVQLVGGLRISMPFAPTVGPGAEVTIAVRAEDVLLATEPIHHLSARNVFQVRVVAVPRGAGDALVRCIPSDGGPAWLVRLTSSAVHALGLVPDCGAWLAVKSHSVRLV